VDARRELLIVIVYLIFSFHITAGQPCGLRKFSTAVHTSTASARQWLAGGWYSLTRAQLVPKFQYCTWQQWANFQFLSISWFLELDY
jgi:hypothetical protein